MPTRGKRSWIPSPVHLAHYGFSPNDIRTVSADEMKGFRLANQVPLQWPPVAWDSPDKTNFTNVREIPTSRLRGSGIEFGVGPAQ